jgi:hypothetical protein
MMSEQLDWTQKLGDAVLAQQATSWIDPTIAGSRAKPMAAPDDQRADGHSQDRRPKQYVMIEPTSPTEIYVPYYEPAVVYGDWPYPDYAPYHFPPPYGYTRRLRCDGVAFVAGVAVRHAFWGNCDWGRRNINVANRNVNINNFDRNNINNFTKWEHKVDHRRVKYNNADVRQKFAKTDIQAGKAARQDFRGKDGQKVLEPDRDRPGAGDRDRPAAGDRDRTGAGDRDRPAASDRDRPAADRDRPGAGNRDRPQTRDTGGRQDAGKGRARRARNQPRKPVLRQARRRASSQVKRANGRASHSATALFHTSNQAPRLRLKPIAAARAWALAEQGLAWPRMVPEERPAWVAEERPVWPRRWRRTEPAVAAVRYYA